MSNHTEPHTEPDPPDLNTTPESDAEPAGPAAEPDTEPESPPRTKMVAAVILAVAALFGGAVVFGGLWLTGQWDGPSVDDPAESVDGFLTALFTDQDAKDAASYTCASQSGDLGQIVAELDNAEDAARFSWAKVRTVEQDGDAAVVTAKVTHELSGASATWTFALVTGDPDDAWRVCGVYPEDSGKS